MQTAVYTLASSMPYCSREGQVMKKKLLMATLFTGASLFAETHFSIGVGIGTGGFSNGYYAAAPPVVAYAPPCPGPGYSWVDGYWSGVGAYRSWHGGYWAPPVRDRFYGGGQRYFRNDFDRDRRDRDRDFRRDGSRYHRDNDYGRNYRR